MPLVNYSLRTMNKVTSVDDVILFASEPSICEYIQNGIRYTFVQRPSNLDTQEAKVQNLIGEFLKLCSCDITVMFHITSPFLKKDTINECVQKVLSGGYDSAFTAFREQRNCWFKGISLNFAEHDGVDTYREPVTVEHSLYVFKNSVFEKTGQRISERPYIKYVDHFEGHDIDTPEDFRIAELIVNTGLFELD